MLNISSFISDNNTEYSIDIHYKTMKHSNAEVMYITITAVELDNERDYTVVLNGLPMPKTLKKICEKDVDAAEEIISDLKKLAVAEACEYWCFQKDEWETDLDYVLEQYKEKIGIVEETDE